MSESLISSTPPTEPFSQFSMPRLHDGKVKLSLRSSKQSQLGKIEPDTNENEAGSIDFEAYAEGLFSSSTDYMMIPQGDLLKKTKNNDDREVTPTRPNGNIPLAFQSAFPRLFGPDKGVWSSSLAGYKKNIGLEITVCPHIPNYEQVYKLPDAPNIRFLKNDKPQEFYGVEACLVRNERTEPEGLYIVRCGPDMLVAYQMALKSQYELRQSVQSRNQEYLESLPMYYEREVGVNCGLHTGVIATSANQFALKEVPFKEVASSNGMVSQGPIDNWTQHVVPGRPTSRNKDNLEERTSNDSGSNISCPASAAELAHLKAVSLKEQKAKHSATSESMQGAANAMAHLTFNDSRGLPVQVSLDQYNSVAYMQYQQNVNSEFAESMVHSNEALTPVYLDKNGNPTLPPRHLNKKTNALYKTEMCRNFEELGECRYGKSCQFAHGNKELRPVVRHNQWKTKTCLAWLNGGCTYGQRCCYAHEILDDTPKQIADTFKENVNSEFSFMPSTNTPSGTSRFAKFFKDRSLNIGQSIQD